MRILFLSFCTLVFLTSQSYAAEPRSFLAGINVLSHGVNKVSKDSSGAAGVFGTSYYNFDFQLHVPTSWGFLLSPRVIWMPDFLYPVKASGSPVATSFLIIGLPITYGLNSAFDVTAGPALLSYQIKGPGGTTTLANGNSTNVFAVPGETQTARTIGVLLGASYNNAPYRLSLDTLTEGLVSNTKRTFSLMFTVSYSLFQY